MTFQVMKALLIIMVIDDHTKSQIGLMTSIFPYDSFFMPLFVISSGYFYKQRTILNDFSHKIKKMFIPYIMWCLIGNIVAYILCRLQIVYWYRTINLRSIMETISWGTLSQICGAGWFVIMLFYVSVFYNLIKNIMLKDNKIADYIFLFISVVIGCLAVNICIKGYNTTLARTVLLRTVFYVQFYHMGNMFHKYWEEYICKINKLYLIVLTTLTNVLLICIVGKGGICFYATASMASFQNSFLPIITSMTGGLFWYEISAWISNRMENTKIVSFIADNTFTIMMVHLFFAKIPNFYFMFLAKNNIEQYSNFDVVEFQNDPWMIYNDTTCLVGFFTGLIFSLFTVCLVKKFNKSKSTLFTKYI